MAKAIIEISSNLDEVVEKAFSPALLHTALNRAVTIAGVDARSYMVEKTPVSAGWEFKGGKIGRKVGGRVQQSLQGGPNSIWKHDSTEISQTIGSNVAYADAIISQDGKHSGGPYQIRPKRKKYLVFPVGPNPKTDVVRTKLVTHPGAKEIARRKTGKSVAIMTQAKDMVEANGEKYVENAVKYVMGAFK
jgi:hypothetical protein